MPNIERNPMTQKKYTKKELKELLIKNECVVTFTKVNGDKREMPCTLDPIMMPEDTRKVVKESTRKENPDVINVWCTDKKGWRSFRIEKVIDVSIVDQVQ